MFHRWLTVVAVFPLVIGCALMKPVSTTVTDRDLKLVVMDLVSVIVQIRQLNPSSTTLNFVHPETEFGKILLYALQDAGYGIHLVTGVRDTQFVSYALRSSETDAGIINDYLIGIDDIEVRREYQTTSEGIFPASLVFVSGSGSKDKIILNDEIFTEQGGDHSFLSGVEIENFKATDPGDIHEVVADSNTRKSAGQRTDQQMALLQARRNNLEVEREYEIQDLSKLSRYRRVVVLFPDNQSLKMGAGNKVAIRELIGDFQPDDVFEVTACDDVDGQNAMAEERAIRVKQEIVSHDIPSSAVLRAPCVRANFRHQSDDSPTPVVIVQYRKM